MINQRYKILKLVGEGRSKVFLAHDLLMNRDIALKILSGSASSVDKEFFKEEFLLLKKLQHPNIIKAYDMGTVVELTKEDENLDISNGAKFLVLEYVEGIELQKYFEQNASEELLVKIIYEVSNFLFYLHSFNLIYSDIKPENILIDIHSKELKFIDFGFVKRIKQSDSSPEQKSGTILYLAPEVLSEKHYDHRADFYSFGVMLYRLLYGSLQFEDKEELSIYKFHLYEEFDFHPTNYSPYIISIVRRLLQKDPAARYQQGFEIILDLNTGVTLDLSSYKIPRVFVINNIALSIINDYLLKEKVDNAVFIKGSSGSGKTALVEEIYYNYDEVIIINDRNISSSVTVWRSILSQILYEDFVYEALDDLTIRSIKSLINSSDDVNLPQLKSIFTQIASRVSFTIIFDDLGKYDSLTLNLLSDIIPILLVNNSKVIVIQNNENKNTISNLTVIERRLQAFNEQQLISYVEKTFSSVYPGEELVNIVKKKSDLLPGNIHQTIQNIFNLGLIFIADNKIKIDEYSEKIELLDKNSKEIFKLRYDALDEKEKKTAQIISLFDLGITINILCELLTLDSVETRQIVKNLQNQNILREDNEVELYFTSARMKSFVYGKVHNKEKLHLYCAEIIQKSFPAYDKIELARHFEIGKNYDKVYELLSQIASEADAVAAYSFEIEILNKLQSVSISLENRINLYTTLSKLYIKVGDLNSSLKAIEEYEKVSGKMTPELLLIKGICLCGKGEKSEGLDILKTLLLVERDIEFYCEVQYEIAKNYFELGDYENAENYCTQILLKPGVPELSKAKCFSFLGVVKAQGEKEYADGIKLLEQARAIYSMNDNKQEVALVSMNMGNIYYLMNDFDKAMESWELSKELNRGIGSLREEGLILISMGVFYYNRLELETAVKNYLRAEKIFRNINNDYSLCLVLINLSESYIEMCEYDSAVKYLEYALRLSEKIPSIEDKFEIYFYYILFAVNIGDVKLLKKIILEMEKKNHSSDGILLQNLKRITEQFIYLFEVDSSNNSELNFDFNALIDKSELEDKFYLLQYTYLDLQLEKTKNSIENLSENSIIEMEDDQNNLALIVFKKYLMAKYFFGKNDTVNAIKKLEEAYSILEDKSITEMTWKIIFMISELSWIRGDIRKAEEFIKLSRSILEFISNNIGNIHKRETYLNRIDRREALLKLNTWENYLDRK